ncbi:MAG TPA: hypothetical protein PLQ78_01970 [Flavipsychrobacter sp.]|nr:hypothetical protein [Flavipsychrobacter sp.]
MEVNQNNQKKKLWIIEGLVWGVFMFLMMGILFPLAQKEPFTTKRVLLSLLYWLIGGLVYGYILKLFQNYVQKRKQSKAEL